MARRGAGRPGRGIPAGRLSVVAHQRHGAVVGAGPVVASRRPGGASQLRRPSETAHTRDDARSPQARRRNSVGGPT